MLSGVRVCITVDLCYKPVRIIESNKWPRVGRGDSVEGNADAFQRKVELGFNGAAKLKLRSCDWRGVT